MDTKDELIKISNRLKEIEDSYKSEISKNMNHKQIITLVSNLTNNLILSRYRITDAINFINKLDKVAR